MLFLGLLLLRLVIGRVGLTDVELASVEVGIRRGEGGRGRVDGHVRAMIRQLRCDHRSVSFLLLFFFFLLSLLLLA